MNPKFVDHLVFRVADLDRTERFYTTVLGPPSHRTDDSVMYLAGETRLFFTRPEKPPQGAYDKESIGLNHMAFGVRGLDELQAVQALLDAGGVSHSGIKLDRYGSKELIWLDDPDGMRLEFYLRPDEDS